MIFIKHQGTEPLSEISDKIQQACIKEGCVVAESILG